MNPPTHSQTHGGALGRQDGPVQRNGASRTRIDPLEAANIGRRREAEADARRLEAIMRELLLAADQVGVEPLARAVRKVAAWQTDLARSTGCGRPGEPVCAGCAELPAPRLSARESEVLRLLTEGRRSPSIAEHLGISIATVEVHRRNIMRKLGLHCVADLTRYAVRQGLTSL